MPENKVKIITVRVSPDEARRAEIVARVEEISVNEVFRRGLECYLEKKRADADFVERARVIIAQDAELVRNL